MSDEFTQKEIDMFTYGVRLDRILTSISRDLYTQTSADAICLIHRYSPMTVIRRFDNEEVIDAYLLPIYIFRGPERFTECMDYVLKYRDHIKAVVESYTK